MNYMIRKLNIAVTLLLLLPIGYAYGDYYNGDYGNQDYNSEDYYNGNHVSQDGYRADLYNGDYVSQNDYRGDQFNGGYVNGSANEKNEYYSLSFPSNCCNFCDCGRGFISAGLIYWRPYENGLDTCSSNKSFNTVLDDGRFFSKNNSHSRDPHFEWNLGYCISAGFEFGCCNWDIEAYWTHFKSHTHNSRRVNHLNIDFDIIDLVTGYNFNLGSCFVLRPFGGLRGGRIDQSLHNGRFPSSTTFLTSDQVFKLNKKKQNFWGVGPLIGLEGDWNVGCGFSLFATGSISWLYGEFDVKFFQRGESIAFLDLCTARKHLNAITTAGDVEVGINWRTCLCKNLQLFIQFGLEHHEYFDFNRFGSYGDLSFDGLNFSAGIEF